MTETYVLVGFGVTALRSLEKLVPAKSVLVVEDPEAIEVRNGWERSAAFTCLAGLVPGPAQTTGDGGLLELLPAPGRIRAVLPGIEYGVTAAAHLASALGLPGAGTRAGVCLRNKRLLREVAAGAGIPQPAWTPVESESEVVAAARGRSCVLKPSNLQGSVGVQLLDVGADASAAWATTVGADDRTMRARTGTAPLEYLVEERLHGREFSVEGLVLRGDVLFLNVTDKGLYSGPWPVEKSHALPSGAPDATQAALRSETGRLLDAVEFDTGCIHAEWIVTDDGPMLVECAGRLPGDGIVDLLDLSYGGSFVADWLTVMEGRPSMRGNNGRGAAVAFIAASRCGTLTDIEGADAAAGVPGVQAVNISARIGDRVRHPRDSDDRLGQVIATGRDGMAALEAASGAVDLIHLAVDPEPAHAADDASASIPNPV